MWCWHYCRWEQKFALRRWLENKRRTWRKWYVGFIGLANNSQERSQFGLDSAELYRPFDWLICFICCSGCVGGKATQIHKPSLKSVHRPIDTSCYFLSVSSKQSLFTLWKRSWGIFGPCSVRMKYLQWLQHRHQSQLHPKERNSCVIWGLCVFCRGSSAGKDSQWYLQFTTKMAES